MKKLLASSAILLSTMLLLTFSGQTQADEIFNAWGALQYGTSPWDEYVYESNICSYAASVMPGSVSATSYYYSGTNPDNVYYAIQNSQANQDLTTTLWVGDFCPQTPDGVLHWSFYSGYGYTGQYSWDSWIYYYSHTNNVQRSQFIWTCSCGGVYFDQYYPPTPSYPTTSTNTKTQYGWYDSAHGVAVGMPYAWSGTLQMGLDGYNNPNTGTSHSYIGWECTSPLLNDTAPTTNEPNYNFLYRYYYYATGQYDSTIHSVKDSLDWASFWTFNCNFGNSPYAYGWLNDQGTWTKMRVFGNSLETVI
jgi:hypothetical protein